ncbi:hypothetical protein [Aliiruegeria lutimaris]|uniref:MFS transporter, DHA2 family, multidrug resistance protein n=1 Tax=Aliiruegeria lutimaris TaxID=571298 RepID=A0A1G9LAI7_9RHOB|nr:hypothetical protein [Aliiruegeria lutimaris]SDL58894.1 MFS transporter, DHA2 family, multidrug resistance protein [Aliiruegeria lutimaris]
MACLPEPHRIRAEGPGTELNALHQTRASPRHSPPEELKNASSLFNLTRNLGGAVGLALINTLLTRRSDFHNARIAEYMSWSNPQLRAQMDMLSANAASHGLDGPKVALTQMIGRVTQQAAILSFIDVF